MASSNYKTERFDKEHKHYGGKIYLSDFETDYRGKDNTKGSPIAERIESDTRWERSLQKRKINNDNFKRKVNDTYGKQ